MSGWSRAGLEMTPWLAILLTCWHHAPLFFLSKKMPGCVKCSQLEVNPLLGGSGTFGMH